MSKLLALVCSVLLLLSCSASTEPTTKLPTRNFAIQGTLPPIPAVTWHPLSSLVFKEAKATNKLVFIFFSLEGCEPCQYMKMKVFAHPRVREALHQGFVAVHLDGAQYVGLLKRHTDKPSWPSYMFVDGESEILGLLEGAMSPDKMGYILETVNDLNRQTSPAPSLTINTSFVNFQP